MRSTVAGQGLIQRSISRDTQSPKRNYIALRNKSRDSSLKKLNSYRSTYSSQTYGSKSQRGQSNHKDRSASSKSRQNCNESVLNVNNQGKIANEKQYSIFTTKERTNVVICNEKGLEGRFINDSIIDAHDLKYLNSQICGQSPYFTFNFDNVFNESHKQERFYSQTVKPIVRNFIEGGNGCVILFGPTQGGKTYTLKGKSGLERGILQRAVEDIFNIVRDNQEFPEESCNYDLHILSQRDSCYVQKNKNSNLNKSKERIFLKVSAYQVCADKILDLLSTQTSRSSAKQVYIDHMIDKQTEEIVSKIRNVTEKVVLNLEDFYTVLQDAFKNRRLESVQTQAQDLRKKSHLIINLTLMKRTATQQLQEISTLNFVELCGSEQAVSQERFLQDSSIKQFVTKSFNGLSSQILKLALKKKVPYSQLNDNDAILVDCLRKTLTSQSNIAFICNVNPSPSHYEHSLPAVKFCARIRDTIVKKLAVKAKHSQNVHSQCSQSSHSRQTQQQHQQQLLSQQHSQKSIRTLESNVLKQVNEAIHMLKDEIAEKQLQENRFVNFHDNDKWALEKLENIQMIFDILRSEDHQFEDKQKLLLLSELNYLRDQVSKFRIIQSNMQTPRQVNVRDSYIQDNTGPLGQNYNDLPRTRQNIMFQSQNSYNPYQQSTYNQQNPQIQYDQDQAFNPLISIQDSNEKRAQNNRDNAFDSYDKVVNNKNHPIYTDGDNQSLRSYNNNCSQLQSNRKFDIMEFQQDYQKQYQQKSTVNKESILSIGTHQNQNDPCFQENEVLNRLHPLVNRSLSPKRNSISEQHSPQPKSNITPTKIQVGFRRNDNNQLKSSNFSTIPTQQQSTFQHQQNQQPQQQHQSLVTSSVFSPSKNPFDSLSQTKQKLYNINNNNNNAHQLQSLSKPIPDYNLKLQTIKQLQVYSNDQEAISDLVRLFKLNDIEGLKLRVQQILKEKDSFYQLVQECIRSVLEQKEQIEVRDQIINEQDQIIELGKLEFTQTIDSLEKQQKEREQNNLLQSTTISDHLKDLQQMIKLLTEEKEQLIKAQSILELENKQLIKDKQDSDEKLVVIQQENDKIKSKYDILKEHEMNIIRDTEDKKNKEIKFYEHKTQELTEEYKNSLQKQQEMEQLVYRLREEHKKQDIEFKKLQDDLNYTQQQLEQQESQIQKDQDNNQELKQQYQQYEQEYQKLEEQRDKYEQENSNLQKNIDKLHVLVEKMEAKIQDESQKKQEEIVLREQKESEVQQIKEEKKLLEQFIQQKDQLIEQSVAREQNLQDEIQQVRSQYDALDKQLTLFKAKEYDKVDVLKRSAELEARLKVLALDNENMQKLQKSQETQLNTIQKEKQELESQLMVVQGELDFIRQANEEHLDQVDAKFSDIQTEITKLRNENLQLKEKEKIYKRQIKENEEEIDELQLKLKNEQRKSDDITNKVVDMESQIRLIMEEKEKEQQLQKIRQQEVQRLRDENKGVILGDIHNMIKNYKDEKKIGKFGQNRGINYSENINEQIQ